MNFVNNLMGVVAPIVTGYIVGATASFAGAFLVAGVVLVIGIVCLRLRPGPDRAGARARWQAAGRRDAMRAGP